MLMFKSVKSVMKELSCVRGRYIGAQRRGVESQCDRWLCDNFYILEAEGEGIAKFLKAAKRTGESDLDRLTKFCEELCAGGILPDDAEIYERVGAEPLESRELEVLPECIRNVLFGAACEGCARDDAQLLGEAIKSFRRLPDTDFEKILKDFSPVEKVLRRDPAGYYSGMDEATKGSYRRAIAGKARRQGESDESVAQAVLEKARAGKTERERHIGRYIFERGRYRVRGAALLVLEATIPFAAAIAVGAAVGNYLAAALIYLPLWEIIRHPLQAIIMRGVSVAPLPRMKLKNGVPREASALITVTTLLPPASRAGELRRRLLELRRSNGGEYVRVCLLADLKGADIPEKPEDGADIEAVKRVVKKLNDECGGGFILAVRPREYSPTQDCFTGRERKRGALAAMVAQIRHGDGGFAVLCGDTERLDEIRYIIALDADTSMPIDTAAELVSVALHPLNRPHTENGAVREGYGVLAPCTVTDVQSARATAFSRLMSGGGGITAYDRLASERYQDLFSEGIFAGKGLLDVAACDEILTDVFPRERVLSHDILEGGYLRCGFVSDVQMSDGFPQKESSYFARLERWVRGDWQNAGFIFGNNPLNSLSRYKLFDNLRRSLNPVAALVGILLSILMGGPASAVTAAVCVFSAAAGELFSALRCAAAGGPAMFSRRYYSGVLPEAAAALARAVAQLVMLPQNAAVCLGAAARALWRTTVSKKNLLEWTTAAQSEGQKSGASALKNFVPGVVCAAVLFVFGDVFLRLVGLAFFASIPFGFFSSVRRENPTKKPSEKEREILVSYAAAMWKYFEELCTAENNYLPPDNMQETPVHRIAERTSPTNIGLMLLCTLAARDFSFISSQELCDRLDRSLTSVEALEKWRGNLLNWYCTTDLKPLKPKYVSTVDSGNFLCCLTALKAGLAEYAGECAALEKISTRIDSLISGCDIVPLYNERRKLFHIGKDLTTGKLSPSYYDLLMSEARMTGYFAIASRIVPKNHWGSLGRTMARSGRYAGPVSWTGTMFEYFMPYIFLPAPEGTLGNEALRFCAWCQRKRVPGGYPWGISESGFYAFDREMNYQYKAHGVQKLGLRRGLNSELVISPYSTFLTLPLESGEAIKNLRRLERLELKGRCGFYEAADFTPSRAGSRGYAAVRSYMAHHVGMSMLCVLNRLEDNVIQRRFMSDEKMAAASALLDEKIPSGAVVHRNAHTADIPRTRERTESTIRSFNSASPTAPRTKLFSNGEWSTLFTDVGASVSLYRGTSVLMRSDDLINSPSGVFVFFRHGGGALNAGSVPECGNPGAKKIRFSRREVVHSAEDGRAQISVASCVRNGAACEQRSITLRNTDTKNSLEGELLIYFEPLLAPWREASEHLVFSKLFLRADYDGRNHALIFYRRRRANSAPICMAAGFAEDGDFRFECDKSRALSTGRGIASFANGEGTFSGSTAATDVCAAIKIPVTLPAKGTLRRTLFLCAAETRGEAVNLLLKLRGEGAGVRNASAHSPFVEGGAQDVIADALLPRIFYRTGEPNADAVRKNPHGTGALWSVGISGDLPIVIVKIKDAADAARAIPYIRLNKDLRDAGIETDVALVYREEGEYDAPIFTAISEAVVREECSDALNCGGGIHTLNAALCPDGAVDALEAFAVLVAPESGSFAEAPASCRRIEITPCEGAPTDKSGGLSVWGGVFGDESFTVDKSEKNTAVPWCHVLANGSFGTMVSDSSPGYTWAINSRENRLTPWTNDTATGCSGEKIYLKLGGKIYDIVSSARATFYPDAAVYSGKAGMAEFSVRISVPKSGMLKRCEIKIRNLSYEALKTTALYYAEPVLGVTPSRIAMITGERTGDGVLMTCAASPVKGYFYLAAGDGADVVCVDRRDFYAGDWHTRRELPSADPLAVVGKSVNIPAGEICTVNFSMSWARTADAAQKLAELSPAPSGIKVSQMEFEDKALEKMMNMWLPSQILQSRFFGRTGFYQSSGAWGFRDQLQDIRALIPEYPSLARRHIIRCAAVQFEQGDVLHWWHSLPHRDGGLRGVRTRCSDDLLWLVFVTAEYVESTGDAEILNVEVPYLSAPELEPGEAERYFKPERGRASGAVYEHCLRATEHAMRFGAHGLPLIGSGDWNDSMNGLGGSAESVWLAQFEAMVFTRMARLCRLRGDQNKEEKYLSLAQRLKADVDACAWEGDRYARILFPDSRAIGVPGGEECEIDSLSQSFAVLCGMSSEERKNIALDTALRLLCDPESRTVALLAPPFTGAGVRAGYIAEYPEGIRENGGQYTHAVPWLCAALFDMGRRDEAESLLRMINPADICRDRASAERYRAEPYALAGDVCRRSGLEGRAGWSLYTGSAAWFYSVVRDNMQRQT